MAFNDLIQRALSFLDARLFELGGTSISVATIFVFALVCTGTILFARFAEKLVLRALGTQARLEEASVQITAKLLYYLLLVLGIGIGLHTIGVNLTGLFAAGAVFAVGIGFAMQNIASNFVSGIILLLERTIKPGDVLEVEGTLVRVRDMGLRSTVARTLDDEDLIIPNATLVQSTVKNYTLNDDLHRVRAQVGVHYDSDLNLVRTTLEEAVAAVSWRVKTKEPVILLKGFGDSAVLFDISVWASEPWKQPVFRSELHQSIWWALKSARLTIAFPQIDVHFDSPIERMPVGAGGSDSRAQ